MTTIRQLIQTSPAHANELFAKLVDTSENAVKTREKLFAELKEELELLASLEEQHLFPVLRKHKDLKDLVREALNDNKATRKLLTREPIAESAMCPNLCAETEAADRSFLAPNAGTRAKLSKFQHPRHQPK